MRKANPVTNEIVAELRKLKEAGKELPTHAQYVKAHKHVSRPLFQQAKAKVVGVRPREAKIEGPAVIARYDILDQIPDVSDAEFEIMRKRFPAIFSSLSAALNLRIDVSKIEFKRLSDPPSVEIRRKH